MSKPISQREARRLKKRVSELERADSIRNSTWAKEWPGGVHLVSIAPTPEVLAAVKTARKLRHVVVCMHESTAIHFYALPVAS